MKENKKKYFIVLGKMYIQDLRLNEELINEHFIESFKLTCIPDDATFINEDQVDTFREIIQNNVSGGQWLDSLSFVECEE